MVSLHSLFLFTIFMNLMAIALLKCEPSQKLRGELQFICTSVEEFIQQKNSETIQLLVLQTNNLGDVINGTTFEKSINLRRIEIRYSLGYIAPNTFKSLSSLTHILLKNNYIPRIRRGIFENLEVLHLDLSGNNISYIDQYSFFNMPKLETLRLRDNSLTRIELHVFNGLPVELLSLSKNHIYTFQPNVFFNMTRLKRLQLDANRIFSFEPKTLFNNFGSKLEILWLHNNSLTEIDRNIVKGLTNLRVLNLDSNQIRKVSIYTFEELKKLEILLLSNNVLEVLDADIFPKNGIPTLTILYINNNRLGYLTTEILARLNKLKYLRMFGNPWQCPCLDLILLWVKEHNITPKCDSDYYNGKKPICVVSNYKTCQYINNPASFYIFNDIHSLDESEPCITL